jgi:hypothetical protein
MPWEISFRDNTEFLKNFKGYDNEFGDSQFCCRWWEQSQDRRCLHFTKNDDDEEDFQKPKGSEG